MASNYPILSRVGYRLGLARERAARAKWRWRELKDAGEPADIDPTIALIVVGRNDNYGGDFSGRLKATLSWNLQFPFNEVIYVEWNPIAEKPSDTEWLVKEFPSLKAYIVSHERHLRCCTNPKMPVMEYFAKNVGIRRATSKWVCLVNADVLIGPDVFKRFRKLRPGSVYGTHNVNIKWTGSEIQKQDLTQQALGGFSASDDLFSVVGNFFLAPRELFHKARGYDESLTDRRIACDGHGAAQLYNLGVRPKVIGRHYHLDHPESCQNVVLGHQGNYFDPWEGVPYKNDEHWGQADAVERPVGERTWYLD